MTSGGERRRAVTTVLVTLLVVAGTGVVVTGAMTPGDAGSVQEAASVQETTTTANQTNQTEVRLRNLSAPERVRVGTNYTVSATIVNRGDEQVTNRVSYQIAGNVIAARLVQIPANGTEVLVFNVTENDTAGFPTGTFTHGVFTEDANVTANLTLVGETTTPANETTTPANETATPANETTAENTTTPEEARTANLVFEDQDSNGTVVTLQSVTVPDGGFVVIHDTGVIEGEVIESMLGVSEYLEPGAHQNVTVRLNRSLNQSQRVVAIAYRDANNNQEYDFVTSNRTADGPYTKVDSREAVNAIAVIEITDETTNGTSES